MLFRVIITLSRYCARPTLNLAGHTVL